MMGVKWVGTNKRCINWKGALCLYRKSPCLWQSPCSASLYVTMVPAISIFDYLEWIVIPYNVQNKIWETMAFGFGFTISTCVGEQASSLMLLMADVINTTHYHENKKEYRHKSKAAMINMNISYYHKCHDEDLAKDWPQQICGSRYFSFKITNRIALKSHELV